MFYGGYSKYSGYAKAAREKLVNEYSWRIYDGGYVTSPPIAKDMDLSIAQHSIDNHIVLQGSDIDGDTLTYTIWSQPSHGVLNGTAPNINYTPDPYYAGQDSFMYRVNDGESDSNIGVVNIEVVQAECIELSSLQAMIDNNEDITYVNTSCITDMSNLFKDKIGFTQDISHWDITQVTDMTDMFSGVTLSTKQYNALLLSWSQQNVQENVTFNAGNSRYSPQLQIAKDTLINTLGWTIEDGGIDSSDTQAPSIHMLGIEENQTIYSATPLQFQLNDNIGINNNSIELLLNDVNVTQKIIVSNNIVTYTPVSLPLGALTIHIKASDLSGNMIEKEFHLFVQEEYILSAIPLASSQSANAPATIRFIPKVNTDTAIRMYYWDFNGDGVEDRSSLFPDSFSWQYTSAGDFNVTLRIVDTNGREMRGSTVVHILNDAPIVTLKASPSNGSIPLAVNFEINVTDNEGIVLYEWDFNGDGSYEYNSTSSGNTSYEYTVADEYDATVKITDSLEQTTEKSIKIRALESGSPSVDISASTLVGDAPLQVDFVATAVDTAGEEISLYEWDFDNDGTYEYNSTSNTANHIFEQAGLFYPRVKVTTSDGRVTYDSVEIAVSQNVSLSISEDTIDTTQAQTTTIHTTTTAKTEMKVIIEDENHAVLKVVKEWTLLNPGSYDDDWDGTNSHNEEVKEGKYFAVLLYKEDKSIKRLDLRGTTGGERRGVNSNLLNRTYLSGDGTILAPFDNRPMRIDFTLNKAADVVSFLGYAQLGGGQPRLITFRNRQSLGKGTYTDRWSGQNSEGILLKAPPSIPGFKYGIWAFTLADNAIVVKNGVRVGQVVASPPIYTPDTLDKNGMTNMLRVHFILSKTANVELVLYDAKEGTKVATRQYSNLVSGGQIVTFDGKDNNGNNLHPGKYMLGIRAVEQNGYRSMVEYTAIRIYY